MKNISRIFIIITSFVIFFNTAGSGLEVDIDEIKTRPINFINYGGKYDRPDSIKDIEGIGLKLARKAEDNERIRFYMKYSVIHAVSKEEPEKFSADIFSIDKDAKVGHIAMVRIIISSFLINRYSYSKRDAEAIALFLTYYNAIYRGNIDYYSSKYKSSSNEAYQCWQRRYFHKIY